MTSQNSLDIEFSATFVEKMLQRLPKHFHVEATVQTAVLELEDPRSAPYFDRRVSSIYEDQTPQRRTDSIHPFLIRGTHDQGDQSDLPPPTQEKI